MFTFEQQEHFHQITYLKKYNISIYGFMWLSIKIKSFNVLIQFSFYGTHGPMNQGKASERIYYLFLLTPK